MRSRRRHRRSAIPRFLDLLARTLGDWLQRSVDTYREVRQLRSRIDELIVRLQALEEAERAAAVARGEEPASERTVAAMIADVSERFLRGKVDLRPNVPWVDGFLDEMISYPSDAEADAEAEDSDSTSDLDGLGRRYQASRGTVPVTIVRRGGREALEDLRDAVGGEIDGVDPVACVRRLRGEET